MVLKTLDGDNNSFNELVKAYYGLFYALALGYIHDLALAEDIVQEGFITIHQSLKKLREPDRFGSWAYTIMKRTAIHSHWKMKRDSRKMDKIIEYEKEKRILDKSRSESMDREEEKIRKEKIMKSISRLPEDYREIMILFFFEELNIHQIAERLKLRVNTVAVRFYRGKNKLRKLLEEQL